ncbi:hypothetical protein TNCV_3013741 [Trichonephila clavipes]|nr:hypothetical protein TNCV_3013741 [Trichonephila clavipes]
MVQINKVHRPSAASESNELYVLTSQNGNDSIRHQFDTPNKESVKSKIIEEMMLKIEFHRELCRTDRKETPDEEEHPGLPGWGVGRGLTTPHVKSPPSRNPRNGFKEADVIKSIKIGRLMFAGHTCRMNPSSLTFRIFNYSPIGTKTRGKPKLRWADCEGDDLKVLRMTNWRTEWKKILEKALALLGQLCQ